MERTAGGYIKSLDNSDNTAKHYNTLRHTATHRNTLQGDTSRPPDPISHVCSLTGKYISRSILLIVQYKYLQSCSGDFYSPGSHPPHKIMRYWFYYSIWLGFSSPRDHSGLVEMICTRNSAICSTAVQHCDIALLPMMRGGGLGSSTTFKKFNEPYAPS